MKTSGCKTAWPGVRRIGPHRWAGVLGLCVGLASPARAAELGATVDSLLEYAQARNPELAAMRHEANAAEQRLLPAGALPDPVLRVELENFNNYGNDARPNLLPSRVGETKYTLMQTLPA